MLQDKIEEIKRQYKEWQKNYRSRLSEKLAQKNFATLSGIPVEPLYTPSGEEYSYYTQTLGFPGQYPFTRGIYPTMYRGRLWTMRQYAGFGTAEESNRRYKYLLEQGQTGLSVAFDLPTQTGYDSDHQMAYAEVGKVGVAISSLKDMETLLDGIPIAKISTSMTINATAALILSMYFAVAEKQNVSLSNVEGTVQNDVLKEYIARGTYIYPPEPSMRLVTDIIEFCYKHASKWNTISISGYHMREAGATAVQEIAFTLANGIAYVRHALERGLSVDAFAPRLSFFFGCHNDFLEEICKFRAARRLWARIMKEKFGARNPYSWMLRFHTQTCGVTLAAQQPEVNIVRVSMQALAAVLGGTQSLHTNSYDEALALPTEHAARIALRTQQVVAHESNVTNVLDPLGGSYFLESLTDELEEAAEEYLRKVEHLGGAVVATEKGFFQREIADSAYKYQKEVEKKERIIVGVNEYETTGEIPMKILKMDAIAREKQIERLNTVRRSRDKVKVEKCLEELHRAATKSENLVPYVFSCVKAYATNGEISDTLRNVFGEYRPPTII